MKNLEQCNSLPEAFFEMVRQDPAREVYRQPQIDPARDEKKSPRIRSVCTADEVRAHVQGFAQFLREIGVRRGSRVAIISQSRPEWMEADMGILAAGATVVAVYPSLTAAEIGFLLFDSGASVVVAENQEQVDKLQHLLEHDCEMPATEDRAALTVRVSIGHIVAFEECELPEKHRFLSSGVRRIASFKEVRDTRAATSTEIYETLRRDDVASLVYTSGTTGAPKGVIQTHGNHLSNVRQARESGLFVDGSTLAVFLPLAHSFAKLMGYIGYLSPTSLEFPAVLSTKSSKADPDSITRDIREGGADIVPVVPRILEKMQSGVEHKAALGGVGSKILKLTLWAAREVYEAKKQSKNASLLARIAFEGTSGIRAAVKKRLFGSKFRFAVSGGAKLQIATNEFFDALGILVLEGYGLTETVVATNINRPERRRIGSVGPLLADDIEVKIAEDGEICFRGPNVSPGYFNRPVATQQSWDKEGWFHTGDLGAYEDGFLYVTGRKKELIVTSGGKKIPPDPIEQRLKSCKFVGHAMMFGDDKPYCIALIALNINAVQIWAYQRGVTFEPHMMLDESLRKEIWNHIETVNESLASYESIKKIRILPDDFTIENGLLTPTLKVRRRAVVQRYKSLIEEAYANDASY